MNDSIKSLAAAVTGASCTAVQCVLGFTSLGAKIGSERTAIICAIGVTSLVVIVVWVSQIEAPRAHRRVVGIAASCLTSVATVLLLGAAWGYHNAMVTQERHGVVTTTTLRAALTPSDVEISFYSEPPGPMMFVGYVRTSKSLVVHRKNSVGSKFVLRGFGHRQSVTLRHHSAQPIKIDRESAKFIRKQTLQRNITIAAVIGVIACLATSTLIWWLSRLPSASERRMPAGFRIPGSS